MSYDELNRKDLDSSIEGSTSNLDQDSLDWAQEAYLRLKKQQQEQKEKLREESVLKEDTINMVNTLVPEKIGAEERNQDSSKLIKSEVSISSKFSFFSFLIKSR